MTSFKTTQYKPGDDGGITDDTLTRIQDMMRGWVDTVMATKRMVTGNKEKITQYYTDLLTYITQSRSTIAVIETVEGGDEPAAVYIKLALGSRILPNPYMRFGHDKFRNLMCDLSYTLLSGVSGAGVSGAGNMMTFWPIGTNTRRVTMDKFDSVNPVWVSRFAQGLEWMIETNPFAEDVPRRIATAWQKPGGATIEHDTGRELVGILVQSRVYVPIVRLWLVLIEKRGDCILPHPMILMQSRTKHDLLVFNDKTENVRQALRSPWVLADRPHKQRSMIGQIGRQSQLLVVGTGGAPPPDNVSPPQVASMVGDDDDDVLSPTGADESWNPGW